MTANPNAPPCQTKTRCAPGRRLPCCARPSLALACRRKNSWSGCRDRSVDGSLSSRPGRSRRHDRAPGPAQALVEKGAWKPVKALADLPQGTPVAFRSGAIEGFLIRQGDEVKGLSAVCTHMGCILNFSKFRNQFECPCHGATFETTGRATDQYDTPLPRLPLLQVRIERGQVEVYSV